MDVLVRIKRLVIARRVEFTFKAEEERLRDGLAVEDVLESVVNANAIKKVLRSRAAGRAHPGERLYVIESPNFSGTWIYTQGHDPAEGAPGGLLCPRLVETLGLKRRRRGRVRPAAAAA